MIRRRHSPRAHSASVQEIERSWIEDAAAGASHLSPPPAWAEWARTGACDALRAPRTQLSRSRSEQLPVDQTGRDLIRSIVDRYQSKPVDFEICAAAIGHLLLPDIESLDLTRPWRDGGRDGVGKLRLGHGRASITVTFALEAKCYSERRSVSIRDTSRLISRIRHREFGILVTTSAVHHQAYSEIVSDGHPIIVVAAADIVELLKRAGLRTAEQTNNWLDGIHARPAIRLTIP
jgi:hypothetical protein